MLLLISPAKKLDFEEQSPNIGQTVPALLDHAQELASIMKSRSIADLKKLMKLSDNLAQLNVERYQQWTTETTEQRAKQAILAFRGDVYAGMAATAFEQQDFDFAQQHLRILSGLYGLLRPLDMIQPHRLEMGTRLENSRGKDLYAYWKSENAPLINLASNEYFSSVESPQLESPVVTPVFKDEKSGVYKVISIYAKKARGMMCDFVIRNRLQQPQQLKAFSAAGYRFSEQDSDERQLLFLRREQDR